MRTIFEAVDNALLEKVFQPAADLLGSPQVVRLSAATMLVFATGLRGYQLALEQSSGASFVDLVLSALPIPTIILIGWLGFANKAANEFSPSSAGGAGWVYFRSILNAAIVGFVPLVVWRATMGSMPAEYGVAAVFWIVCWAGAYLMACQRKQQA